MALPVVAIVGRPNVGKSTFFNKLIGKRVSIEENTPGVTRDRIYGKVKWLDYKFTLIDTGGIDLYSDEHMLKNIREQANIAIELADLILFLVDGKDGVTPADEEIALSLKKFNKKVIMIVNKIDDFKDQNLIYDFYNLGFEPLPVSSINMLNLGDILDEIVKNLNFDNHLENDENLIKVAIVGKPNAGKSSLVNLILGEDRLIVTPIAGTTRESVDTEFSFDGINYQFTDTAGIRRKKKINNDIEHYSVLRSFGAIDNSDIAVLVVDANEGFTEQDKRIIGYAHEEGKGIIVLINKWDLIEKNNKTYKRWKESFYDEFPFIRYALIEMISVVKKERTDKILNMIKKVYNNRNRRIATGGLNELINEAILMHQLPKKKGKMLKIYYVTQAETTPPTFVMFINSSECMHFSYLRYIENRIRESYDFSGTPIRFVLKPKSKGLDL